MPRGAIIWLMGGKCPSPSPPRWTLHVPNIVYMYIVHVSNNELTMVSDSTTNGGLCNVWIGSGKANVKNTQSCKEHIFMHKHDLRKEGYYKWTSKESKPCSQGKGQAVSIPWGLWRKGQHQYLCQLGKYMYTHVHIHVYTCICTCVHAIIGGTVPNLVCPTVLLHKHFVIVSCWWVPIHAADTSTVC